MIYALIYFILLNAKTFTGPIFVLKFLPNLVLLIGVITYMRPNKGTLYIRRPSLSSKAWVYILFLLVWAVSILRTARPGASVVGHINDLGTIFMLSLVLYQYIATQFEEKVNFDTVFTRETIKMLLLPSIIIATLLSCYILGYNNPSTKILRMGEEMVILKALGIKMVKKAIPFTGGAAPNLFGIWSGGTFVLNLIAIMVLKLDRRTKIILYINGLVIFGFLLFADSRGTLFSTIVTAAVVYMTFKFRMTGFLRVFVIVVPIMPFIFVTIMGLLAQTFLAEKLSRRGGAQNLSTLSARTVIWEECLKEFGEPKPIHLIGWGEHGEKPSGVVDRYIGIFPEDWESLDDGLMVTHNFFFQAFFDTGYLGVFLIMYSLLAAMNNAIFLFMKGYRAGIIFIAFLVYYVLSGALESTFGNHFRAYAVIFLLIMAYIFAFRSEYDRMTGAP